MGSKTVTSYIGIMLAPAVCVMPGQFLDMGIFFLSFAFLLCYGGSILESKTYFKESGSRQGL